MATYKLIQDIEAEDHILGPLTLRQFIYGLAGAFFYYLSFIVITKHVGWLLIIFLPPALFATLFAFPFKRDQPTEVWLLALLRFFFKPKVRIWNQSGVKDLVTITVPKKQERHLTNGLSQTEVQNRLQALATTLDSGGWVVKNVASVPYIKPSTDSDRLVAVGSIPRPVPDSAEEVDIFDSEDSRMQDALSKSNQSYRNRLMESMRKIKEQQNATKTDESDEVISKQLKNSIINDSLSTANLHKLKPQNTVQSNITQPVPKKIETSHVDPAVLNFALNNSSSISIQTLAHEASKKNVNDEVVINLR